MTAKEAPYHDGGGGFLAGLAWCVGQVVRLVIFLGWFALIALVVL